MDSNEASTREVCAALNAQYKNAKYKVGQVTSGFYSHAVHYKVGQWVLFRTYDDGDALIEVALSKEIREQNKRDGMLQVTECATIGALSEWVTEREE